MSTHVFLDGRLLESTQATVSITNPAFLHGVGLFETLRAYHGRPFMLDAHIARATRSAETLNMPVSEAIAQVPSAVAQVLAANNLTDARIRFTVTPPSPQNAEEGPTLLVAADVTAGHPQELYDKGMTTYVCDTYRQSRYDPSAGHKTTSYLPRLLALRAAQERGCGEALWFTPEGWLAEGSISNVFFVKDGMLRTPPLDTPALPGVTRALVLELARADTLPIDESPCTLKDLLEADEVFLTNAIMELMPVTRVERHPIADEKPGPVTHRLHSAYRDRVRVACASG